jgi:hypothetical protein
MQIPENEFGARDRLRLPRLCGTPGPRSRCGIEVSGRSWPADNCKVVSSESVQARLCLKIYVTVDVNRVPALTLVK